MYVLLEGEVDIFLGDFVLETAGPGSLIGEMALIEDNPRTANAVAKSPAKLAQIDRHRFHFLVQQTPHFATDVMKTLADRLRHMNAVTAVRYARLEYAAPAAFAAARTALPLVNANRRAVSAFCCVRYDGLRATSPASCRFRSPAPANGRATAQPAGH